MADYGYEDIYAKGMHILTKVLTLADTEYALGLASVRDIKRINIKARSAVDIRVAIVSGETATNYLTVPANQTWAEWEIDLDDKEIYLRDPLNAGTVIECLYLI